MALHPQQEQVDLAAYSAIQIDANDTPPTAQQHWSAGQGDMPRSRHHLTIGDKNRLRRHHRQHPELTQEQLREWAYARFGQWVARSTVGHIVRAPEEVCANPQATRFQSGRYPDMEQELYAALVARAAQLGADLSRPDASVMSDAQLWAAANEILKRTRGSDESVSVAWVHRFKKRHGLHRSQLKRAAALADARDSGTEAEVESEEVLDVPEQTQESGQVAAGAEQEETAAQTSKRATLATGSAGSAVSTAAGGNRSHFVASDDILLLTHVLAAKPWEAPYAMDGWLHVVEQMRADASFRLEKTAGACQARLHLLLGHLKAANLTALRKAGTENEFERKCALLREVATQMGAHERAQNEGNDAAAAQVPAPVIRPEAALSVGMPDLAQERERMAQRRLELMERKMERELAAQKRHSEEQVSRLEKLHREQQEVQQQQHAQLLATIQQQQAMMMELIRSLVPDASQIQDQQQA
ncbi:hypothetical protein PRIC2_005183 [Phytophthora ramorum]